MGSRCSALWPGVRALLIPVDNYDELPSDAAGGLQPKQPSLLAVGNTDSGRQDQLGREFGKLKVELLSPQAQLPQRATAGAAGYDIHASADVDIKAKSRKPIPTGIAALASPGTYIRVAPRSGLALQNIDVAAGVIDPATVGRARSCWSTTARGASGSSRACVSRSSSWSAS